ncbi:hypothetical protein C8A03DRAFT_18147 [Achaetomium macrosporum]|uniref:Mid2 domain-containing protein n=1 Tax=Achaetomium macrosporum TaxID=79813 RepID=A0AAN7HBN0_9PEZI|nr:hypothetical protein C8A03DRAFT_18147 [Achaetomium macrosporum]
MASPKLGPLHLLCAAISPLIILLLSIYPPAVGAQDSLLIDCYRWDGAVSPNNTKCPNSNACCGPKATCLSNRLCANPGDSPNVWVRGPCAVKGWDDGCAQICKYTETRGGVFPRVTPCLDGSLCCNNDPQCCQDGKGIFLDESGNVVSAKPTAAITSYPPVSDGLSRFTLTPSTSTTTTASSSSLTTSTTSTTPSNAAATTTSSTTPSAAPASNDDDTGLKVGLGLGIPLAVIVTACVAYLLFRRRASRVDHAAAAVAAPAPPYELGMAQSYHSGVPKQPGYYSTANPPAEIMGHTATELDSQPYSPQGRYELS